MIVVSDFDGTLYFLDEKEIEFLRQEVANEYAQDIRRNVLSMLLDVMELQPFSTVRAELVSILESFLPYLLGASDFRNVAYVLRETKVVIPDAPRAPGRRPAATRGTGQARAPNNITGNDSTEILDRFPEGSGEWESKKLPV